MHTYTHMYMYTRQQGLRAQEKEDRQLFVANYGGKVSPRAQSVSSQAVCVCMYVWDGRNRPKPPSPDPIPAVDTPTYPASTSTTST